MLERIIYTALKSGIEDLTSNPSRLNEFFTTRHGLSTTEAAAIRTYFLEHPPNIIHSYPRKDSKFPLYAIILGDERESTKFIGDDGGLVDPDELELGVEIGSAIRSSLMNHEYIILVATAQPDVTIYYYELAKYFLVRARGFLKDNGFLDTGLAGQDMAPDPRYLPEFLFLRRLVLSAMSELNVIAEKEAFIRSVDGIYIDDGSGEDRIGAVKALTTVLPPESA